MKTLPLKKVSMNRNILFELMDFFFSPGFIDDSTDRGGQERHQSSSSSKDLFDGRTCWELNYKEAAIYLQEGENNLRFDTHPKNQDALPAYILVHNMLFYLMDLSAATLIMALAVCEKPSVVYFLNVDESVSIVSVWNNTRPLGLSILT